MDNVKRCANCEWALGKLRGLHGDYGPSGAPESAVNWNLSRCTHKDVVVKVDSPVLPYPREVRPLLSEARKESGACGVDGRYYQDRKKGYGVSYTDDPEND